MLKICTLTIKRDIFYLIAHWSINGIIIKYFPISENLQFFYLQKMEIYIRNMY